MGPVCIHHKLEYGKFPPSPAILWIELSGKPKWLPLKFGYHDAMRTGPHSVLAWNCENNFSLLADDGGRTVILVVSVSNYFSYSLQIYEISTA